MLIQITNRCHEGCSHCLQASTPDGAMMEESIFRKALQFGAFLKTSLYVISGGEPTEHPQFIEFCNMLDRHIKKGKIKACFCVASNGMWYPDMEDEIKKLARLESYVGMQVYTNPKWYKDADFILSHKTELSKIPGVSVDTTDIPNMQDLGRARTSENAQAEIKNNPYHMSCLNGHLLFKQLTQTRKMDGVVKAGLVCKPTVDYLGRVHLSESCHCPSFGNVNTDLMLDIFKNLQDAKPCCKCALGRKFLESSNPSIVGVRNLIMGL